LLSLALTVIVLGMPGMAQAATNVVVNPGFEQGGCGGSTPVLCDWQGDGAIAQDTTNPHSGNASMHLDCGSMCFFDPDSAWEWTDAYSTVCVTLGPGAHAASFWYRDAVADRVSLDATFYYDSSCTFQVGQAAQGQDSLVQQSPGGVGWQQVSGALHAPTNAKSALVSLTLAATCSATSCPSLSASFDDVSVADVGDPTPAISSITPTVGWFGTRVWIYGFDFTGTTSVTFNGVPAQFSVQSDGWIDTNVPTGATSGPISVTTANGTGWSTSSFTLVPPPVVSSFTPTGGPFGTVVDIRGSNFTGALSVNFGNGLAQTFTVDSDSEIHAVVPNGATTGPIMVTNPGGTGTSSSSFALPTPTISSFIPTSGPPGTSVDIHGTNLTGTTAVTFGGVVATFTVDSDSEIHATVPSGARTGWISVATNVGSTGSTSTFSVVGGAPSTTSITPLSGPVGTSVDIHGANFTGTTSVTFGYVPATFTVDSDSELHTTVPSGATNSYITIVTPLGSITAAGVLFVVTASPPTISSFTPSSGPVGTSVDIHGANFTGASSVTFNGAAATYTVNSDSEVHASVPSGASSGLIGITTSGGTGASSASFTVLSVPTIAAFSPGTGQAGTKVTISGSNFAGVTSVRLGGAAARYTVNSATTITVVVPSTSQGTYKWSVTNPAGTGTSTGTFKVLDDNN
jgi:hypothetical protein